MIYSFFSATLPALSFSLFFTFDVPLLRISPQCTMYSPSFHLIPFPLPAPPFFLSVSLSHSFSLFLFCPILCVSLHRRVRPCARTCASKRSNAPASQHGPAPSSCIAVSLDLHDPHESPRDSLPTSELRRWTKEESKTIQRYTTNVDAVLDVLCRYK